MITVKLQGGLGNQMFQYALGRVLAERNKDRLQLDLTFLLDRTPKRDFIFRDYDLDIFQASPHLTLLSRIATKFPIPFLLYLVSRLITTLKAAFALQKYVTERSLTFHPEVLHATGNIYLDGYWQSEKYFRGFEDLLRRDFCLKDVPSDDVSQMQLQISSTTSVCVNVRRGDLVTLPRSARIHGFVGPEYYRRGIEAIATRFKDIRIFVTSDEIEWCIQNLRFDFPTVYLGHKYEGRKFGDYLRLMSACRHFLIPNSSFAWWAAWLGRADDKIVITPIAWFKEKTLSSSDLIPEDWIAI